MRSLGWMCAFLLGAGLAAGAETEMAKGANLTATFPLGAWTLVTLPDAQNTGQTHLLRNVSPEIVAELLPDGTFPLSVNAFLVQTGEKNILIDTGLGVQRGGALAGLTEVGLTAGDIDVVLITHMHGDHIGGLLTDGRPTFAKAEVWVAADEKAYWFSDKEKMATIPPGRLGFDAAREVLASYGDRARTFAEGVEIVPGVTAFSAYGHTPGHNGFLLAPPDGGKLLVWGDLMHCLPVQIKHPEVSLVFDVDQEKAAATRRAVLTRVAAEGWPVAGMHLPFPGVGRVTADGYAFAFQPGLK